MSKIKFVKDRNADPSPLAGQGKPQPESIAEWAARFYRAAAASGALYRKDDGSLWVVSAYAPPKLISTMDMFLGQIPNFIDVVKKPTENEQIKKKDVLAVADNPIADNNSDYDPTAGFQAAVLSYDDIRILFNSDQINSLPLLRAAVFEPVILVTGDRRWVSRAGYDPSTGIYYWLRPGSKPIEPIEGTHHLRTCFSGVPFESDRDRNNIIAFLLSYVIFDFSIETPMLVVTGNTQGIGKSKTIDACGYILSGQTPAPVSPNGEEFTKQVGARFLEGSRFINIDNATGRKEEGGSYKNTSLAQLVTQSFSKRVRALGHNRSIEAKGVAFALSANNCRLEADLASRSLPVKLYAETSRPMSPFVLGYAMEHRNELYGELLWLALQPAPDIDPSLAPTCRFRSWLSATNHRVTTHFGPPFVEAGVEISESEADFYSWGFDYVEKTPNATFNLTILKSQLTSDDSKYKGMRERFPHISQRAKSIALALFLKSHRDVWYQLSKDIRLRLVQVTPTDGHSQAQWSFEVEMNNDAA